ncbi:MAG: hypothetical protein ABJN34_06745 [Litoreibacter sp.]|uniref:hypothetical protein n=1 Tax=Litoreibacter sp. TaxID=1969459 RepID=UPI003297399D
MNSMTFLEDFSEATPNMSVSSVQAEESDEDLRASFDDGYKCGWQDGAAATERQDLELKEAISVSLQSLNFTYFEAREHAMQSVRPVLQAMVDAVLPELLSQSLGGRLVELLGEAADGVESSVSIACAPENVDALKELVADVIKFPITIEGESTLSVSQAILHLDEGQTLLDLGETLDALRNCIDTFFETPNTMEAKHA